MPKIRFISQDKAEIARYICFTARSIQLGKFNKDNYYVLPRLVPGHPQSINFPDFTYSSKFWKELEKLKNYSLTEKYLVYPVSEVIDHLKNYQIPNTTDLQNQFTANWTKFLQVGENSISVKQVSDIRILITEYGSIGSFSRSQNSDGTYRVYVTSRFDFPWQNIYKTLLQALILIDQPGTNNDVGTIGYHQRNAILRHLLTRTPLHKLHVYSQTTVTHTHKLIAESQNYLARLGFPVQPSLNPTKLINLFTPQENSLFAALNSQKGRVVTFDEAGLAVWGNEVDQKYSLYSLAKLIENLRKKLRLAGHQKQHIYTLRKQGYLFNP